MNLQTAGDRGGLELAARTRSAMHLLLPAGLIVAAAFSLFARFHAGAGFLTFYEDDFFYYLRIAQHIAAGHHSTFDGTHLTNGYHPLWMLILVALVRLFGTGPPLFFALQGLALLSVLATYAMAVRAMASVASGPRWLTVFLAAAVATSTLLLVGGGMEVLLAIPLVVGMVLFRFRYFTWTLRSAFLLGLIAAALVLARLDAAILVAMMVALDFVMASAVPLWQRLRCAGAFLCGASPVALYLILNKLWFGTLMPISGQSKQMRFHHWPSAALFLRSPIGPPQRIFVVYPLVLASVAGLVLLPRLRRKPALRGRFACVLALLLFPFVYIVTLSVLSDWPVWEWYLYPLIGSGLAAAVLLTTAIDRRVERTFQWLRWPLVTLLFLVWIVFCRAQWINTTRRNALVFSNYLGGAEIAGFANKHPGIYGMGDRAGIPAYLYSGPMVQLEGLVMDKTLLNDIRLQRPLSEVLRDYNVRYYVGVNLSQHGNCWHAIEPIEAGPDAPHMQGDFCMTPVAEFRERGYDAVIFDFATSPSSSAQLR